MKFAVFLLFSFFYPNIWAQHAIELQLIGEEISEAEQKQKDFCESKYCLLDSAHLLYGATQNKSIKPCNDFKEFSLGTFEKYKAISDRKNYEGFFNNIDEAYQLMLRKVLAAKVSEKDTRVTKALKKIFSKCVNSRYVRRNGVNEMRAYLKSLNLNFYPEENQHDFNVAKLFEGQPYESMRFLLQGLLVRGKTHLRIEKITWPFQKSSLYFESIADMFYEMFEVYKENSVNAEKLKENFRAIAQTLNEFFELQQEHAIDDGLEQSLDTLDGVFDLASILNIDFSTLLKNPDSTNISALAANLEETLHALTDQTDSLTESVNKKKVFDSDDEEKGAFMSIGELDNLTSSINLDWSKIINNSLLTEFDPDEKIYVASPQTIENLAKFMATVDKKSIADYFVYNLLYLDSRIMLINPEDKWKEFHYGTRKSFERWDECIKIIAEQINPAVMSAYVSKYGEKVQELAMKEFLQETKTFAVEKIKAEARVNDTVKRDLVDRVSAIKVVTAYSSEYFEANKIEELYSHLKLNNDKFVEALMEIHLNHKRDELEPKQSEISRVNDWLNSNFNEFTYSPLVDDVMFIHAKYLHYPFYHYLRPRFFNSATVGFLFFRTLNEQLKEYLKAKYQIEDTVMFPDELQVSYEFYKEWLKSGGKDLELGAHRLTSNQIFWVAAARVTYEKHPEKSKFKTESKLESQYLNFAFYCKAGFQEAFHCDRSLCANASE